jgi:hypothetical protein
VKYVVSLPVRMSPYAGGSIALAGLMSVRRFAA